MNIHRASLLAVATVLVVALTACERPAKTAKEPVAATVGGNAISEAELDRALARLGTLNASETAEARGKVLEALVDQYLVSNAARTAKLDQEPEVALALQQAQRQVLVEAYIERLFKDMAQPLETEIQDYYAQHPELFAQRKLYRLQELALQLAPARVAEVEARLKQSRGMADFAEWLRVQGIEAKGGVTVKAAEQIPATMLTQLVNMKDGQMFVVPMGANRISVLQLQGSQAQSVTLEQASDAIKRILLSEKRKTLLEAEVRKLRASGKIEYASGFAAAAQAANSPDKTKQP